MEDMLEDESSSFPPLVDAKSYPWRSSDPQLESKRFMDQLSNFMQGRGTPLTGDWRIGDVEIDPKVLFEQVELLGGFHGVTQEGLWLYLLDKLAVQVIDGDLEEQYATNLKRLFWSKLFAFERVLIYDESDTGIDYSRQPYDSLSEQDPTTTTNKTHRVKIENDADSSASTRGIGTQRHNTGTSTSEFHMDDGVDDEDDEYDEDEGNSDGSASHGTSDVKRAHIRSHGPVGDPDTLMEMFTTRPEHGRPLTWRNPLDVASDKFSVEDFTKTPLPLSSKRLLARQREGLLMHKIERALRNPEQADAALKTLVTRSWSRSFFLALYPTMLERLLRHSQTILQRLTSFSNELFNLPGSEREGDLTRLLRISIILRNLSHNQQNVSLLASHPSIVALLCDFSSLDFFAAASAHQRCTQHYTIAHIRNLQHHLNDSPIQIPPQFDQDTATSSNETLKLEKTHKSPLVNALSVLLVLKCDHSASILQRIQFNAMEALSKFVHLIRFRPVEETGTEPSQVGELTYLSQFGKDIQRCLPMLVELALSTSSSNISTFLAVELLAKISMNPNSRYMWSTWKPESLSKLMSTMIRYAIIDDELSDWAMLAAYHLALNAMTMPIAQSLGRDPEVLDNLMLLASAYVCNPKAGPSDFLQSVAYRHYVLAMRSSVILHKLVWFVPLGKTLLKYENVIADIYLHAPVEIADPMYRVFLELQS